MQRHLIDGTYFTFPESWKIVEFDNTEPYSRASSLGVKGCDLVAINNDDLWLIEVKDYTYPGASAPRDLSAEVCRKATGTMGLLSFWARSSSDSDVTEFAKRSIRCTQVIVALHIELKDGGRGAVQIRPALANRLQSLKATGKPGLKIDNWAVTSTIAPSPQAPWTTTRDPSTRHRHADR